MPTESFRERNRRRRQENAFEHLREYASSKGLADPDTVARETAEALHGAGGTGERKGGTAPAAAAARPAGGAGTAKRAAASEAPAAKAATPAEPVAAQPEKREAEPAGVPHRLEDRTKDQLYARAQELEIEGRSSMTKEELIEAIRAKQ